MNLERWLSRLFQVGVLLCACLLFTGGFFYLMGGGEELHPFSKASWQIFSLALIQLGILLLLFLPLLRVLFCGIAFALQHRLPYVWLSLLLSAILLFSLLYPCL